MLQASRWRSTGSGRPAGGPGCYRRRRVSVVSGQIYGYLNRSLMLRTLEMVPDTLTGMSPASLSVSQTARLLLNAVAISPSAQEERRGLFL